MKTLTLWILVVLCPAAAMAASPDEPHPHAGIIAPFKGKPALPELSAKNLETLANGKAVQSQIKQEDGTARGLAVQDVHATPEVIWDRILKFEKYTDWVSNVTETEVYERKGQHIKVRFVLNATIMSVEYYIDHIYNPEEGYMTWTLDYSRQSDLDDSVGFWRVEPIPNMPGWSRLYYSVDVKLKGWVPGFIENSIAKSGLTKATAWVKRESESAQSK
jgi:hypothetical protein